MAVGNFFGGQFFGGGFFGSVDTSQQGVVPSGGIPQDQARTQRDISRARRRLGLKDKTAIAEDIIADVAARQAKRLELDAHKRFEELQRELEVEQILLDASHIEALNTRREALIDAELKTYFKRLQEEEELLMLIAASVA